MHPTTTPVPPRRAAACSRASTARDACIRPAMEWPTILPACTSLSAQRELALTRRVLRDSGQPQRVWSLGGELASDVVVMHGRAWAAPVLAPLGPERAVPLVLVAQLPGGAGGHGSPGRFGLVPQQAVPELRVVLVGIV